MTFEEYLQNRGRSAHTVEAYLGDMRTFEKFLVGREPTLDLLEGWATSLNHGRLKPQSIARHLVGVRRWLAFRARHGSSAAQSAITVIASGYQIGPSVRQKDRALVPPVSDAEYDQAMGRAGAIGRAIMATLWWTGARISEVVGDSEVGIPALTIGDGKALINEGHVHTYGKGGKRRVLILPSAGRLELRRWVEERASGVGAPALALDSPLFPIGRQQVWRILQQAGPGLHAHRFRHSYRARLRKSGVSDEIVRALMGHGPASVTEGYGVAGLEEMQREAERI